jgi:hypothetical protein
MAGKGSNERRKKGVKRRTQNSAATASKEDRDVIEEDSGGGGGTLMGLRGGFKSVAGTGGAKGNKTSLLDIAFYVIAGIAAVVLVTRYAC